MLVIFIIKIYLIFALKSSNVYLSFKLTLRNIQYGGLTL